MHQEYPPETQENYNSFSSGNPITEKGNESEYPEGAGGGKGYEDREAVFNLTAKPLREPGVPPKMHTFSYVAQTIINDPYPTKPEITIFGGTLTFEKSYNYYKTQVESELTLPVEQRRGLDKQFFIMYIMHNNISIKSKFAFLSDVLKNMFMIPEASEKFMAMFSKMQRTYHALSKFAYICKFKTAKILMDKDVYLTPLVEGQPRVFALVQNNKKYLFSITDLINILNNSLGNAFFFVAEPMPCKNPYTNMPFNKSTLYNIYFFIKQTAFVMPHMFHRFFVANFNLQTYAEENVGTIRGYSIKQYINSADTEELYFEIINMLQSNIYGKRIKIDPDFPKERLVEIMRPYLELFYKGTYTICDVRREQYIDEYTSKIRRFHRFNKAFGQKRLVRVYSDVPRFTGLNKYKATFNEEHVKFNIDESAEEFMVSHA